MFNKFFLPRERDSWFFLQVKNKIMFFDSFFKWGIFERGEREREEKCSYYYKCNIFLWNKKIFCCFYYFGITWAQGIFHRLFSFPISTRGEKNVITDSLDVLTRQLKIQKVKTIFKIKINYHVLLFFTSATLI